MGNSESINEHGPSEIDQTMQLSAVYVYVCADCRVFNLLIHVIGVFSSNKSNALISHRLNSSHM